MIQVDITNYPGIAVASCQPDELFKAMEMAGFEAGLPAALLQEEYIVMRLQDWKALYTLWEQEQALMRTLDDMEKEAQHIFD